MFLVLIVCKRNLAQYADDEIIGMIQTTGVAVISPQVGLAPDNESMLILHNFCFCILISK